MNIETPEGIKTIASSEDRLLDQIENRITFLKAELEAVNSKLQREKRFFKRRQLEDQKDKLELELRWARFQEKHLTKSIFGRETRST